MSLLTFICSDMFRDTDDKKKERNKKNMLEKFLVFSICGQNHKLVASLAESFM